MKAAVIGAGVSGVTCSINLRRKNIDVDVYEKNSDALKKLLLTGNGKCNYKSGNNNLEFYHSDASELISKVINAVNLDKMDLFLDSIGVVGYQKNDCFYPVTEKSYSIKSALMNEAKNIGVNFYFDTVVDKIKLVDNKFLVNGKLYDKLVIASGSLAMPKCGNDGFSYTVGNTFNHKVIDINPSLVQLVSNMGIEAKLAGNRCKVRVSHYEDGIFKKDNLGEIQFTSYGLSGICIFNLSRDIRIGLNKNREESVHIDFLPWLDIDVLEFLSSRNKKLPNRSISSLCDAFLDYKISNVLFNYLHIDKDKNFDELSFKEKESLASCLKNFCVEIVDTKTFLEAQTCSGGIDLRELDLANMESLKVPNLHFIGEAVDLDGDCGGYNLTIAWITGILVGDKIVTHK